MSGISTPRRAAVPAPDAPVFTQNEVKGFAGHTEMPPDRYFYFLNENDETLWQADGYRMVEGGAGGKEHWSILLVCPSCGNNLKLDSTRKRFRVGEDGVETDEPIQCPYPAEFGGLCKFRVELQPPKGERFFDFRTQDGTLKKIRVDALMRRA